MAALTQNDLKGYIIGNNQFNFQDARVDDLEIPDIEWDYDANTYTLTLSGISQFNDGGL